MAAPDEPRRFARRERAALLIAAEGICPGCDRPLEHDFHADHREPWSLGGLTDVINGQALCPACNRRKGTALAVPGIGDVRVAREPAAATAAAAAERRNPARAHGPAGAGHGAAPECHQEIL